MRPPDRVTRPDREFSAKGPTSRRSKASGPSICVLCISTLASAACARPLIARSARPTP